MCLAHHDSETFTPEVLNDITASCLVTQLLEMGVIKLCMYLLNSDALPLFDLLAFTGYKYLKCVEIISFLLFEGAQCVKSPVCV